MRNINQYLGLVLIAILFVVSSCTKQDIQINENPTELTPTRKSAIVNRANVTPIIVNDALYAFSGDIFTSIDFTIEDEIIMLSTNYNGGCNIATFTLAAQSIVNYAPNNTPIIKAKLILENEDKCSYPVKNISSYDLKPIQQAGYNTVILDIEQFGQVIYNY